MKKNASVTKITNSESKDDVIYLSYIVFIFTSFALYDRMSLAKRITLPPTHEIE